MRSKLDILVPALNPQGGKQTLFPVRRARATHNGRRRVDEMRRQRFVEVHTATPIVSLDFDGDGVAIIDDASGVWHGTLPQGLNGHQSRVVAPVFIGTVPVGKPAPYLASTWTLRNAGLFLGASDGHVFQISPRGEIVVRADLAAALAGSSPAVVLKNEYHLTPPSISPVTTSSSAAGTEWSVKLMSTSFCQRHNRDDVLTALRRLVPGIGPARDSPQTCEG